MYVWERTLELGWRVSNALNNSDLSGVLLLDSARPPLRTRRRLPSNSIMEQLGGTLWRVCHLHPAFNPFSESSALHRTTPLLCSLSTPRTPL